MIKQTWARAAQEIAGAARTRPFPANLGRAET